MAIAISLGVAAGGVTQAARPAPVRAADTRAMHSDFDGDGYADLAIGVPGEGLHVGAVNILYGSPTGLNASGDQIWSKATPGLLPIGETDDGGAQLRFGDRLATGDFDADGHADLAIGISYVDPLGRFAGGLRVIHGSDSGLTVTGNQVWAVRDLPGVGPGDWIGPPASGDFDGDGFDDIAFGVAEGSFTIKDAQATGAVMYGGPGGLDPVTTQPIVAGPIAYAARISTLASGDFDGDGFDELVATNIDGFVGSVRGGVVYIFRGTATGLADDPSAWTEDTPGVPGKAGNSDYFGASFAIGDFEGDGFADLAIGAPGKRVVHGLAGSVTILRGSPAGLTTVGAQIWHQASPGIPGTPERGDAFGTAVAAGDFDGNGRDDLAIGAPTEHFGRQGCGTVTVLKGGAHGLTSSGAVSWSQDSPGVPGTAEDCDRFGATLAAANYGSSRRIDLAIGVPQEQLGKAFLTGMVDVLYGSRLGLRGVGSQGWSQGSPGIKGSPGTGDEFGWTLAR